MNKESFPCTELLFRDIAPCYHSLILGVSSAAASTTTTLSITLRSITSHASASSDPDQDLHTTAKNPFTHHHDSEFIARSPNHHLDYGFGRPNIHRPPRRRSHRDLALHLGPRNPQPLPLLVTAITTVRQLQFPYVRKTEDDGRVPAACEGDR